jgi:hypothetical protein
MELTVVFDIVSIINNGILLLLFFLQLVHYFSISSSDTYRCMKKQTADVRFLKDV